MMMRLPAAVIVVVLAALVPVRSSHLQHGVARFNMDSDATTEKELFDFLMKPKVPKKTVRLTHYQFKNCGDPATEIFNVKELTFGPDPIQFPGPLTVIFQGDVKKTLDSPLKATILLERRFGNKYIRIPCIEHIGSCTYDNVCDLLNSIQACPDQITKHGLHCNCPFKAGSYNLPKVEFEVLAAVFPAGDLHIRGELSMGGTNVTCVDIHATFD